MLRKKAWLGLTLTLGVALTGSLLLNLLLLTQAKKYYLEVNAIRLDPLGLRRYSPQTVSNLKPAYDQIVLLGDSRAAAWQMSEMDDWLKEENYAVINRGINSQTSTQVLQRFGPHFQPLNPSIVVLQVGINDLKTVALFPDRRQEIVTDCQRNIAELVTQSKQLGATVVVTTIFPVGDVPIQRQPFWSDDIAQAILDVNATITALADDDVIVLDAFSLLVDDRGMMDAAYQLDELHVNPAAYRVLNQALMQALRVKEG